LSHSSSTLFPYTTLFRSELRKIDFVRPGGQISAMRDAKSVYGPYVATMKEMCVSRSSSSFAARMTEGGRWPAVWTPIPPPKSMRSEEHTSELQSRGHLVC